MSFEDKQNNFAATDKQFLPEPSAVAAGVAKIDQKRGQKSVLADGDLKIQGSQTLPVNSAVVQAASPETEVQAAHATKMATLTHLITSEVAVMHQFKPDKLEVVLRPDSQTQILLQLNMKEGKIDGTARCDQGDFSLLSTHWAELQRTMEGQGVRLAPLREAGSGFYSGQNFQGSSHSQQQERNPAQTVISEFAKGMLTGAPKASLEAAVLASSRNDQLLQMWA